VRVSAPPEGGRANDAVLDLLGCSARSPEAVLSIVSGHTGREKVVEMHGIDRPRASVGSKRPSREHGDRHRLLSQALLEERARVQEALDYLHDENPGSIQDETQDSTADNHPATWPRSPSTASSTTPRGERGSAPSGDRRPR
jgi:hypothetical protein